MLMKSYLQKPQRWNIGLIRNFMLCIGSISYLYQGWTEISSRDTVIATFWKGAR